MKTAPAYLAAFAALCFVAVGCASRHEEGVKSAYRTQWTKVAATTAETTEAAREVLADRQLRDIDSKSTAVDGLATAKMADGTKVNVAVEKLDEGSQVSVTVGALGNPKLGAELANDSKMRAEKK